MSVSRVFRSIVAVRLSMTSISISASRAASRSRRARRILASRNSTEAPWPGSPSRFASRDHVEPSSRSFGGSNRTKLMRFRKSSTPSGEEKRAVPPVGSTWFGPAR